MGLLARPGSPGRGARRAALQIAVEHGVNDFYMGAAPALVPFLIGVHHYTLAQAGGVVLAATLLSSLAQPLFGVLTDRHPRPWVADAGLALAAAGIGMVGLLGSYLAVCAAMTVSGLGAAAYHPESTRRVHRTDTGDVGMSWFSFGGLVGFAAGPALVAALLTGLGLVATPLLVLPAVVVVARHLLRHHPHRQAPGTERAPEHSQAASASTDAARDDWRRFAWLTVVVLLRSILFYGLTTFLAVFLIAVHHATTSAANDVVTGFTGLGALATLAAGPAVARLGRVPVVIASYTAAAPLLVAVLLAPTLATTAAAAVLLGAAISLPVPIHTTLGHQYLPTRIGTASAVTLGLAVNAGGLATPALGALADHHGPTTALTPLLLAAPAVALAALALRRHRPSPVRTDGR